MVNVERLFIIGLLVSLPVFLWADVKRLTSKPGLDETSPLVYWQEAGYAGGDYPVHVVRLDLRSPKYEVAVVLRPAPAGSDGDALLSSPVKLSKDNKLLAAVNANPFVLPEAADAIVRTFKSYVTGTVVVLDGFAVSNGELTPKHFVAREGQNPNRSDIWLNDKGELSIGYLSYPKDVWQGATGFEQILKTNGQMSRGNPTHPQPMARTAVGMDADKRYLYLVVAEGRHLFSKTGYTVGQLSRFMKSLGCNQAMMFDASGSSVMVVDHGHGVQQVSTPAELFTRPVPVLFGVREKE